MGTSTERLQHPGPIHPARIEKSAIKPTIARQVRIRVHDPLDHEVGAVVHEPRSYNVTKSNAAAVVLISGAGGGVSGPAGIYPSLADKLGGILSVPCMRLDYREPAQTTYCSTDVIAALDYLAEKYRSSKFVLVGWSFGGSPCFTVAAKEPERVWGVATIASQTAKTEGVAMLSPRPLLLLHGTNDTCLSPACSENLYRAYGSGGKRELRTFEGDDHGLSRNAVKVEKTLFDFVAETLGFGAMLQDASTEISAGQDLAGSRLERIEEMRAGHDLEGGERL